MSRICLIEDDPIMGESLADRFTLEGFACDWHRNARSAVAALKTHRYAVAISDYRLPDTDGVTLVKELRQTVGEPVPAILISGEPNLLQLPDVAYSRLPVLRKPARGAALLLEMRRLLVAVTDDPET